MIQKISALIRTFEEEMPLLQLLGPFSLLCTLMLAGTSGIFQYDLLAIGVIGLFMAARWKVRGAAYALCLLAVSAGFKHLLVTDRHALQFGIESSVAFALLISAMAFEEGASFVDSLHGKIGVKDQNIRNLEEEIQRLQEQLSDEQIASSEKISALSQTVEEVQAEGRALQILNDVLRKSTAKALDEKGLFAMAAEEAEVKATELLERCTRHEKELARLGNESILVEQNKQLFNELNGARLKEAQTHQINETLVRLHAKEHMRVKELEAKTAQMEQEIGVVKEQASFAKRDAEMQAASVEQLAARLQEAQKLAGDIEPVQTERNFLRERLQVLENELQLKNKKLDQLQAQCDTLNTTAASSATISKAEVSALIAERDHLIVQMEELRSHLQVHAKSDALYRQLREQFEEKNKVLHQTRQQLFLAETQLQTLKQELDLRELESDPVPPELRKEIAQLEEEIGHLTTENLLLQDMVTHFMAQTTGSPVKKKLKKTSLPDQDLLF